MLGIRNEKPERLRRYLGQPHLDSHWIFLCVIPKISSLALKSDKEIFKLKVLYRSNLILAVSLHTCKCKLIIQRLDLWTLPFYGRRYFADLRMTFRQKYFLQDWFRNGVGLGLELVFGIGLVLVKPLLRYVLSL